MKVAFLDRDGVLNHKHLDIYYVTRLEDFHLLPGATEGIVRLNRMGFEIFVSTNQPAIAKGLLAPAVLAQMHARLEESVAHSGGRIHGIYHCPHRDEDGCECRKPKPGLLLNAFRDFPQIDRPASCFIGDGDVDEAAAGAAGIQFFRLPTNGNLLSLLDGSDWVSWRGSTNT